MISIILPAYNSDVYLADAIASVVKQTFGDWELLIVDDGSTDESLAIALQWSATDDRIRVLRHPGGVNRGQSASRNLGIEASTGEWIALIDSDDLWLPRKLERQVAECSGNEEVVLCYTNAQYIDQHGSPVKGWTGTGIHGNGPGAAYSPELKVVLDNNALMHTSSVMFRRAAAAAYGFFDNSITEGTGLSGEDTLMWCCLFREGAFVHVPEVLACYRIHGEQWMARRTSRIHLGSKLIVNLKLLNYDWHDDHRSIIANDMYANWKAMVGIHTGANEWDLHIVMEWLQHLLQSKGLSKMEQGALLGILLRRALMAPVVLTKFLYRSVTKVIHR